METNELPQSEESLNGLPIPQTKDVYQADLLGFFIYATIAHELALAPGYFNIPYGAYEDAPPEATPGMVARRINDEWQLVEDHRNGLFWVVESKQQYAIGTIVSVGGEDMRYDGGGAVPAWLTDEQPVIEPPLDDEQQGD